MTTEKLQVKLELNHKAAYRERPTPEGFTHDWMVTVRGPNGSEIEHFVEKVVFYLHESFKKPKRSVKAPPYTIAESGYAGFTLPIDVCFRNKDEPKKITFWYDLFLHAEGCPPVNNTRCEKLTFENPTPEFRAKLLKAGAYILDQNHQSPPNVPPSPSAGRPSSALSETKPPSSKPPPEKKSVSKSEKSDAHKSSESKKSSSHSNHESKKPSNSLSIDSKKLIEQKKSPKTKEVKVDPQFTDLFGAPIKSAEIERPKERSAKSSKDQKEKKHSIEILKSEKDSHSRDTTKLTPKATPDSRKDDVKKHEKSSSKREREKDLSSSSKNKERSVASGHDKLKDRKSPAQDPKFSKEKATHSSSAKERKHDSSSKHKEEKDKPKSDRKSTDLKKLKSEKPDRPSSSMDKNKTEKNEKSRVSLKDKEKTSEKRRAERSESNDRPMSDHRGKDKSKDKERKDSKEGKKSKEDNREKEKVKSSESQLVRSSSRDSDLSKYSESRHESSSKHRSITPERIDDKKRHDKKDPKDRKSEHKYSSHSREKNSSLKDKDREAKPSSSTSKDEKEDVIIKRDKPKPASKKFVANDVEKKPLKPMEKLESLFSTGENSDVDPFDNRSDSDSGRSAASSFAKLKVKEKPLRKLLSSAHDSESEPESPLSPPAEETKPFVERSPIKKEDTRSFSPHVPEKKASFIHNERKYESSRKRHSSQKCEMPPKRARIASVDETPTDPRLKPRNDVRKSSLCSEPRSDKELKFSVDMKEELEVSDSSSSGSSDSANSDDESTCITNINKQEPIEFTEEYLIELVKIQQKLMASRDRDLVQKVVDLVGQTDCFDVDVAFNFDLCSLDKGTVYRIRDLLQCGS